MAEAQPIVVNVTVTRCDPSRSPAPYEQTFRVPLSEGMTVLQALDYIYEHIDPTLAYYDHALCAQGTCRRCWLLVDGEVTLACRRLVTGDLHAAPLPKFPVLKDLVSKRRRAKDDGNGSDDAG